MATPQDLSRLEQRLERLAGIHARLDGRRQTLREQEAELVRTVGLAKGRVALRKPVETFIEEIQAEAYRRSTHSFSTLLTTLVQEVLPNARPIALELTTERGLPSLDISVESGNGEREDIFEDHGGALNNVIGMGLRLIAVVKAGGSKFLALDEPECWVKPDRIPAFFKVLEDASRRLGVQTVSITHHDAAANFSPDVRISTLTGTPEQGAQIRGDRAVHPWSDDEEGFRHIRLVDFQAFADARMDLGPGVNALVGPNDHGKSSVIRALRAMFYGETRDSLIRHGAKGTTVELGLSGGRTLRFSRERKRNPKNLWSLLDAGGKVVVENGTTYETGGTKPPEWVDALFGMNKIDGLDIHLAHQKYPVFLLDRPATQRAAVLAIGQESGYTNDMLAIHKEWTAQNNATIKEGELRVGQLRQELAGLEILDEIGEMLTYARTAATASRDWMDYIVAVERIADRLAQARNRLDTAQRRGAVYEALSEVHEPDVIRAELDAERDAGALVDRLVRGRNGLARARARKEVLDLLPAAAPTLDGTGAEIVATTLQTSRAALERAVARRRILAELPEVPTLTPIDTGVRDRLDRTRADLAAAVVRQETGTRDLAAIRSEIDEVLRASDGHCPTCGHLTSADGILSQHSHAA